MPNTHFEQNADASSYQRFEAPKGKLAGFLISKGIAKDEGQANLILIGIIVLCLIIIAFSFMTMRREPAGTSTDEMQNIDQRDYAQSTL